MSATRDLWDIKGLIFDPYNTNQMIVRLEDAKGMILNALAVESALIEIPYTVKTIFPTL